MREADRTVNEVLDTVAEHYQVTREQLLSDRALLRARHLARYLACRVTRCSFRQIGTRTGGVTGTNVLAAYRKFEREMANDVELAAAVDALETSLVRGPLAEC
jgi:chromosomal replication initiation ATPase DnaA